MHMPKSVLCVCLDLLVLSLFDLSNAFQQWSTWTTCLQDEQNCTRRVLVCDENSTEKYQCRIANSTIEELTINCTGCDDEWSVLKEGICDELNEDFAWETSICPTNQQCSRRRRISCRSLLPCQGEWRTNEEFCHAACNESGTQMIVLENFSYFPTNNSCIPIFDTFRTRIEMRSCDNEECNNWSSWKANSSCSASCGGGFIELFRTCLNNSGCSAAKEFQKRSKSCNNQSCPTWSSWTINETCTNRTQLRSRACFYDDVLANNCNDEKDFFQTSVTSCSSTSDQTEDFVRSCDRTFHLITLPLIAGFVVIVIILLVSSCCIFRRFKRKDFKIVKVSSFSTNDRDSNHNTKERYYPGNTDSEVKMSSGCSTISSYREKKTNSVTSPASLKNINETEFVSVSSEHGGSKNSIKCNDRKTQSLREPAVVFQRVASSPDILKETNRNSQSEHHVLKPRPSVRRAERLRLQEQQKLRKMRRRKEKEDFSLNETQTLRTSLPRDHQSDLKGTRSGVGRERSRSADFSSEFEFKPLPVKPSRRRRNMQAEYENVILPDGGRASTSGITNLPEAGIPEEATKSKRKEAIYENVLPGRDRAFTVGASNSKKDNGERRGSVNSHVPVKPKRNVRGRGATFNEASLRKKSRSTDLLIPRKANPETQFYSLHSLNEVDYEDANVENKS